jgi:Spy/CpxP family protein refolding chaperone
VTFPATRHRTVASRRGLTAALTGITLYLCAPAAAAQSTDRHEPWWLSPTVQAQIALTLQQAGRIDAIYRESWPERRRLRRQVMTLQRQLEGVLAKATMSDDEALRLISRLCAADRQHKVARTMMLVRMHWVLTPTQRLQLAELSARLPHSRERSTNPVAGFFPR